MPIPLTPPNPGLLGAFLGARWDAEYLARTSSWRLSCQGLAVEADAVLLAELEEGTARELAWLLSELVERRFRGLVLVRPGGPDLVALARDH